VCSCHLLLPCLCAQGYVEALLSELASKDESLHRAQREVVALSEDVHRLASQLNRTFTVGSKWEKLARAGIEAHHAWKEREKQRKASWQQAKAKLKIAMHKVNSARQECASAPTPTPVSRFVDVTRQENTKRAPEQKAMQKAMQKANKKAAKKAAAGMHGKRRKFAVPLP